MPRQGAAKALLGCRLPLGLTESRDTLQIYSRRPSRGVWSSGRRGGGTSRKAAKKNGRRWEGDEVGSPRGHATPS